MHPSLPSTRLRVHQELSGKELRANRSSSQPPGNDPRRDSTNPWLERPHDSAFLHQMKFFALETVLANPRQIDTGACVLTFRYLPVGCRANRTRTKSDEELVMTTSSRYLQIVHRQCRRGIALLFVKESSKFHRHCRSKRPFICILRNAWKIC